MPETLIEVRGAVKHYQGLRPLRVRSLVVRRGDRVALSGFDQVTGEILVNLLNGAIVPDEGEIVAFGRPTAGIATDTEWLAALDRFGIVSTRAVLLEGMTLAQNLALPFTLDIDVLSGEVRERISALADEVGLDRERLDRPAADATADEKLRVHLARSLALDPDVLVLEHPTLAIPREAVPGFASAVRGVAEARGLAVVAVTEDEEFASRVAGRSLRLDAATGELAERGGWRQWFGARR